MQNIPVARSSELVVQSYDDGVLLYDLAIHKAYSLNEPTTIVWGLIDGQNSVDEIARKSFLPKEIVLFAIDEMQKQNLLKESFETGLPTDKKSRRKMLFDLGVTAVALPIVAVLVAPRAVQAQSCRGQVFGVTNPFAVTCADPDFPAAGPNGSDFCSDAGCTFLFMTNTCPSGNWIYNGDCIASGNSSSCTCTCC